MRTTLGGVTPGCRQRLTAHYGPSVNEWLDDVPTRIEVAARSWELRLADYHDAGHASVLAVAKTSDGDPVIVKAWFDHDRYRNEVAALRHWEPINDRVVRAQDDALAAACLAQIGPVPGGGLQPAGGYRRVTEMLACLHSFPVPETRFPTLDSYLQGTVEPRVRRRLRRYGFQLPGLCVDWELDAKFAPTSKGLALLHGDLYRENVLFTTDARPVFLDPLPMLGDPAFDWAFFIVYFDLARDPIPRLHVASLVSGIGVPALVPWCLRLCLDGLLYYRETGDDRQRRMQEVMSALAAEGGNR